MKRIKKVYELVSCFLLPLAIIGLVVSAMERENLITALLTFGISPNYYINSFRFISFIIGVNVGIIIAFTIMIYYSRKEKNKNEKH